MKKFHSLGLLMGLTGSLLLTGCGGSGEPESATQNGNLEIAITDAEEDFLSYQIDLDEISLTRANGTQVSVLPLKTEIDFVQYQELSELFAVLSVPAGNYTGITLSLDYTDANIVVQDEAGVPHQASAVDQSGHALTKIDVELKLNEHDLLRVTPFKTAQLTLDLDLAASNTIESFEPAKVTVEPFMLGTTFLDSEREHRLRGLLDSVAAEQQELTLNIRPMRVKHGEFGQVTLQVNEQTHYEINGVEYDGAPGLAVLADLAAGTPVVTYGSPADDESEARYLATQVHAGSSVGWADQDVLKGTITARSGNTITLSGAVVEREDQAAHLRQTVQLSVSDATTVTGYRLGDSTTANLSVGQSVLALGQYDPESGSFNAEQGTVRMKLTSVIGEVAQVSPLQLDLSRIDKRPVAAFDFSGTGSTAEDDADPSAYEVATSELDLSTLELQEWVQVRGYPSAFGSAPMDFDALSIINPDFSAHPAKLLARWPADGSASVAVESGKLVLNAAEAEMKLHLRGIPGSALVDFTVTQIDNDGSHGRFAILEPANGIHVYREFSSFTAALSGFLAQDYAVAGLTASGQYSDAQQSLTADYVTVRIAH